MPPKTTPPTPAAAAPAAAAALAIPKTPKVARTDKLKAAARKYPCVLADEKPSACASSYGLCESEAA